jgi:D-alanyl-D-alanine carboxypeptidase
MVLQLVDEGRVELDEPLSAYLPDTPVGGDVTVRSLLSHRSGIPNYTDQSGFFVAVLADRNRTYSPDEILEFVADEPVAPTDQQFSYSNTNYILLGQLIEKVTVTELPAALRTRIAEPLALEATTFAGSGNAQPGNLAAGWSPGVLTGDPATPYESIASSAWAAGALISTTGDLARFLTGLFAGELISEESLDQMTDVADDGYGLGLFAARLGPDSPGYAHNGVIPGYTSTMAIDPVSGDVLVILTNNDALIADQLAPRILLDW